MKLNVDAFYKLMDKEKIVTKIDAINLLKISKPTLFNALKGGKIGGTFIEQFVAAFPKEDIRKYLIFEEDDSEGEE